MGKFLTSASRIEQVGNRKYKLLDNELYKDDDGSIYLAWQNYVTDNFTWINSNGYDTRCAHIHDVGCQFHSVVRIKLTEEKLKALRYLCVKGNKIICKNISEKFLEVVPVTGNWINNLFYRMLRDADTPPTPKVIQYLYRAGVSLNFKWFLPNKKDIDLTQLYNKSWDEEVV